MARSKSEGSKLSLATLKPAYKSKKIKDRVGRGEGSGLGKTSGRGGKGQTARNGGGVRPGFEGGQMPLYRRISKWGFRSRGKITGNNRYHVVNLSILDKHFADGATVGPEELKKLGFGRTARNQAGYKLLGTGKLTKRLSVKVHAASEQAKSLVEKAGGTVEIIGAAQA